MVDTPHYPGLSVFEEDGRVRLDMAATLDCIDRAVEAAACFFAKSIGGSGLFPILTALREALLNAVTHGCHQTPGLIVTSTIAVEGHTAVIEVSDPGQGFDWRKADAAAPGLESDSGRGMHIISFYADSVEYNDAGNTLKIRVSLT